MGRKREREKERKMWNGAECHDKHGGIKRERERERERTRKKKKGEL